MLCERITEPRRLADRRYIAEPKLDGQRAQLHVRDDAAVAGLAPQHRMAFRFSDIRWRGVRPPKRFGMRLKQLRNEKGWSQATLARKLGVTREYLARLEAGLHDPPLSTVERLAKILRVSITKVVK